MSNIKTSTASRPHIPTPALTVPKAELIVPLSNILLTLDWDGCFRNSCDTTEFAPEQKNIVTAVQRKLSGNAVIFSDNSAQSIRANGAMIDIYAEGGVVNLPTGELLENVILQNLTANEDQLSLLPDVLDDFAAAAKLDGYTVYRNYDEISDQNVPRFVTEGKNVGKLAGIGINYGNNAEYGEYAKTKLSELLLRRGLSAAFELCHTGTDCWELKQKGAIKPTQLTEIASKFEQANVIHLGDGGMDNEAGKVAYQQLNGGLISVADSIDAKQSHVLGKLTGVDDVWGLAAELAGEGATDIKFYPGSGRRPKVLGLS